MSGYSSFDVSKLEKKSMPDDYSSFYEEVLNTSERLGGIDFVVINDEGLKVDFSIHDDATYINGVSEIYDRVLAFICSDYLNFKKAFLNEVLKHDKNKNIIPHIELAELLDESGKYDKPIKFKITDNSGIKEIYLFKDKRNNGVILKIDDANVGFYELSSFIQKNYINFLTQKKNILKDVRDISSSTFSYSNNSSSNRKSPLDKFTVNDGNRIVVDVNSFLKENNKKRMKREKNKPSGRAYQISKSILRRLNP